MRIRTLAASLAIAFGLAADAAVQAPKPGPLLTDPARGDLRMLLDKAGLGSSEVSIGERTYHANYTSTEHVHQGIEILYVLEGQFQHEINGRTYVLNPGMIGVVKVGDKVRHKTGPGGPVKLLMIWVPGEEGARVAEGWVNPAR
jgi:quercetin dioxygenase-like cupin family protein